MKKDFISVKDVGQGNEVVQVTADSNPSYQSKSTQINIQSSGGIQRQVSVAQSGWGFIITTFRTFIGKPIPAFNFSAYLLSIENGALLSPYLLFPFPNEIALTEEYSGDLEIEFYLPSEWASSTDFKDPSKNLWKSISLSKTKSENLWIYSGEGVSMLFQLFRDEINLNLNEEEEPIFPDLAICYRYNGELIFRADAREGIVT